MADSLYDEALKRVRSTSTSDSSVALESEEISSADRYSIEAERSLRGYDRAFRPAEEETRFIDRIISQIEVPRQASTSDANQPQTVASSLVQEDVPRRSKMSPVNEEALDRLLDLASAASEQEYDTPMDAGSSSTQENAPQLTQENTLQSGTLHLSPEEAAEIDRLLGREPAPQPAQTSPDTNSGTAVSADLSTDGKFSWSEAIGNAFRSVKDFAVSLTDPQTLLITGAVVAGTIWAAAAFPVVAGGLVALAAVTTVFSGSKFLSGILAGGDEAEKAFSRVPELLMSAVPFLKGRSVLNSVKSTGLGEEVTTFGRFIASLQYRGGQIIDGIASYFGKGRKAETVDELIKTNGKLKEFFNAKLYSKKEIAVLKTFKDNMKKIDEISNSATNELQAYNASKSKKDIIIIQSETEKSIDQISAHLKKLGESSEKIKHPSLEAIKEKVVNETNDKLDFLKAELKKIDDYIVESGYKEMLKQSRLFINKTEDAMTAAKKELEILNNKYTVEQLKQAKKKVTEYRNAIDEEMKKINEVLEKIKDPKFDKNQIIEQANIHNSGAASVADQLDKELEAAKKIIEAAKNNVRSATEAAEKSEKTKDAAEALEAAKKAKEILELTKSGAGNLDDTELTEAIGLIEQQFKNANDALLKLDPTATI